MRSRHAGPTLRGLDTAFSLHSSKARQDGWSDGGSFSMLEPGGKTEPAPHSPSDRPEGEDFESAKLALSAALTWWDQLLAAGKAAKQRPGYPLTERPFPARARSGVLGPPLTVSGADPDAKNALAPTVFDPASGVSAGQLEQPA